MASSFGDIDLTLDPHSLFEIKTEDIFEDEGPLTASVGAETRIILPSYVHLEEPGKNQIKEEAVIQNEYIENDVIQGNCDVTSCDYQMDENSSYDSPPFKEENSSSANDPRVRKCSVILYRMSMQEVLEWQDRGNHSKRDKRYKKCELCPFKTPWSTSFERHWKVHTGEKPFACTVCDYKAIQREHVTNHERKKHGIINARYYCDVCDFKTNVSRELVHHTKEHHADGKVYYCDVCDFKTAFFRMSVLHMKDHHTGGDLPFSCRICKFWAGDLPKLKVHMRKHKGLKKCEYCEYRTPSESSLTKHRCLHTGERAYRCKHCDFSSSNISNFYVHMRIHTGEKPYKCNLCDYRGRYLRAFKAHMNHHNSGVESSLKCRICSFVPFDRKGLALHMVQHPDEEFYTCDGCDFCTYHKRSMKEHIRRHLGKQTENTAGNKKLDDLVEANNRLMRSLQSPQTSSGAAIMKHKSSDYDELHDTLLTKSEVQNGSEDESGASDAEVMFL